MLRFIILSVVLLLSATAFAADKEAISKPVQKGLPEIPELLERKTPKMTAVIKLHHIKAALMVFWLDPKNNPAPADDCLGTFSGRPYPAKDSVGTLSGRSGLAQLQPIFELPQGIDKLVTLDEQNSLLASGTIKSVEELQQLIKFADMPLKQVQADVTIYQVNRETLEKLGPVEKPTKAAVRVFMFTDAEQKIIDAAIVAGQAKTLAIPKLITHNNQAACIELTNTEGEEKQTFGLSLIPTVNGDGTLTVLAQPLVRVSRSIENQPIPTVTTQTVHTVFMVRDGDTAAIALPSKENQNWLYLITPRLLKEKLAKEQREAPLN